MIVLPYGEYPSCLHTTLASLLSQKSSQMVPQVPLIHTSTLPTLSELLTPLMRTDSSKQLPVGEVETTHNPQTTLDNIRHTQLLVENKQLSLTDKWYWIQYIPWHCTPASSEWEHEKIPFIYKLHSVSEDSSPVQWALPIRIGPDPCPKCAP